MTKLIIENNRFSRTIDIASNTKEKISIVDINDSDITVDIIINVFENSSAILNLASFSESTKKNYNITVNHFSSNSYSECNVFGVSKNGSNIKFDLTAKIDDLSLSNKCKQSISGVLLTSDSSIIGAPNLIINTNSIKAEHSLSIGKINQNKLFYLMSKGLNKKDALYLLIMGYFNNCLKNLKNENLKEKIESKIKGKL
ncbi:MAG: SufD family Fe-S cluster assembly protein [Mycoplasmoidaceae bacterium]